MDNQLSIDLDTILGIYDRMPFFLITLIDMEILDDWAAHPSVWGGGTKEAAPLVCAHYGALHNAGLLQGPGCHCVQGIICPDSITSGAHQPERCPVVLEVCDRGLCGLSIHALVADVLSSTTGGKSYTLLPISSNPDIDQGPLHSFVATTLPIASREGHGGEMPVCIKLLPCFGSSK